MFMKNALLSVYHKDGIVDFARSLIDLGWELFASGGTCKAIQKERIPIHDVAYLVGGGAILGHRVVTLSREVHAGLLANPDSPEDMADLERLGIPFFDLVCVDLYPLTGEIAREGSTVESVTEMTDIGGPTMLRAAAKGRRLVIGDPADREFVIRFLQSEYVGNPAANHLLRLKMAAKAERIVADYVDASASFLEGVFQRQEQMG